MSDVRVNLLPREVERRGDARRGRGIAALIGLVLVAVMAVLYVLEVNRVNDAEERLAAEEATVTQLEREVAELQEFAQLRERADESAQTVASALADEATVAGILQDIAAVMPTDAEMTALTVTLGEGGDSAFGAGEQVVGQLAGTGLSLRGHAPGLERFLLEFDKVAAFSNVYFSSSTVDEEGITTFSFEIDLGPEVLTLRYADGLPEELR